MLYWRACGQKVTRLNPMCCDITFENWSLWNQIFYFPHLSFYAQRILDLSYLAKKCFWEYLEMTTKFLIMLYTSLWFFKWKPFDSYDYSCMYYFQKVFFASLRWEINFCSSNNTYFSFRFFLFWEGSLIIIIIEY